MMRRVPYRTGFCGTGSHQSCPVVVRQGDRATPCTCGCHQSPLSVGASADLAASGPTSGAVNGRGTGDRTGTAT